MSTTTTRIPALQACCGKHHAMPFQHVHIYQDKRGRTRHQYECARCFKTLEARGLRPGNIRWTKRGDPHCETCAQEINAELDAVVIAGRHIRPEGWF